MSNFPFIHNLPSDVPGKTWREKNLEARHEIPLWTLVEVDYEGCENPGIRLYVCKHTRDCDGTPLYSLTWDMKQYQRWQSTDGGLATCGYSEDSLKVVKR